MAEDYGKQTIVAILNLLTEASAALDVHGERQIVDLSRAPQDATFMVEHMGRQKTVTFNRITLSRIEALLDRRSISPASVIWRPGNLDDASSYSGAPQFRAR